MDDYMLLMEDYLNETIKIDIYSYPHFVMETFLAALILLTYCFLYTETTKLLKKLSQLNPHAVLCRTGSEESLGKASTCTSITHYREFYHMQTSPTLTTLPIPSSEPSNLEERRKWIINLTPSQFVQVDKERKKRDMELNNCMASLSTLCKDVLNKTHSTETLQNKVEFVKENVICNKMSLEGKYLGYNTEAATRSIFNILETMILENSVHNTLPYKGDVASFALDITDLLPYSCHKKNKKNKWGQE